MVWEAFLNGQSDKKLEPKLLGHDAEELESCWLSFQSL